MKNYKMLLIATLLGVVLIAGQPHAMVTAINAPSAGSGSMLYYFDDSTATFSVDITHVQYVPAGIVDAPLDSNGFNRILNDGSTSPIVRFNVTYSGYTLWTNSTGGDDIQTAGTVVLLLNGDAIQSSGSENSALGFDLLLDSVVNTFTFLYIGWDETDGIVYAQDTVSIIVGVSDEAIDNMDLNKVAVPVSVEADDHAEHTTTYDSEGFIVYNSFWGYAREVMESPDIDGFTFSYVDEEDIEYTTSGANDELDIRVDADDMGEFVLGGEYNTSGFTGDQFKGLNYTSGDYEFDSTHTAETGIAFFSDSTGLTPFADVTEANILTSTDTTDIQSQVAALFLSPRGRLASDLTEGGDQDGVFDFDGSFDFAAQGYGVTVLGQGVWEPRSVVTSTVDEPGFGVLLAMSTVGLIAYIAPRLRKD